MNENLNPRPPQEDSDVKGLLKKILQQLSFLEKKLDSLIRPGGIPFARDRGFSRRPRPFARPGFGAPRTERPENASAPDAPSQEPASENKEVVRKKKRFFRPGQDVPGLHA